MDNPEIIFLPYKLLIPCGASHVDDEIEVNRNVISKKNCHILRGGGGGVNYTHAL